MDSNKTSIGFDNLHGLIQDGVIAEINKIYLGSFEIILYLMSIANENNIAECSLQTIARNTGYGRDTVRVRLRELENAGLIMRLHCARGKKMQYAMVLMEESMLKTSNGGDNQC